MCAEDHPVSDVHAKLIVATKVVIIIVAVVVVVVVVFITIGGYLAQWLSHSAGGYLTQQGEISLCRR